MGTPSRRPATPSLAPHKLEGTLAFMFETRFPQHLTAFAAEHPALQADYGSYGKDLVKHFDPSRI